MRAYCVRRYIRKKGRETDSPRPECRGDWGGVYGPALCVYCSSVGVVLIGIVGLGDVGGYPACPVPEFLDLGVER